MYDLTKYFIDFQTSENNLERKNWKVDLIIWGSDLILKKYLCMYVELYAFHPNLLQTSVNIVYHERKKNRRETWALAKNFMQEKGKKICKQHIRLS